MSAPGTHGGVIVPTSASGDALYQEDANGSDGGARRTNERADLPIPSVVMASLVHFLAGSRRQADERAEFSVVVPPSSALREDRCRSSCSKSRSDPTGETWLRLQAPPKPNGHREERRSPPSEAPTGASRDRPMDVGLAQHATNDRDVVGQGANPPAPAIGVEREVQTARRAGERRPVELVQPHLMNINGRVSPLRRRQRDLSPTCGTVARRHFFRLELAHQIPNVVDVYVHRAQEERLVPRLQHRWLPAPSPYPAHYVIAPSVATHTVVQPITHDGPARIPVRRRIPERHASAAATTSVDVHAVVHVQARGSADVVRSSSARGARRGRAQPDKLDPCPGPHQPRRL